VIALLVCVSGVLHGFGVPECFAVPEIAFGGIRMQLRVHSDCEIFEGSRWQCWNPSGDLSPNLLKYFILSTDCKSVYAGSIPTPASNFL
jgi:hypothetical protein